MAGSRTIISVIFALSAFLAITAVYADDSSSSILTPIATSPVADYVGADAPSALDAATGIDAEAPDAGSIGSPVSAASGPSGETTPGAMHSGASKMTMTASIAVAGAFVGYLAF